MVSNNHMANNGITATLSLPQLLAGLRKNKLNLECKYLMISSNTSSVFSIQYSIFTIQYMRYSIFNFCSFER